MFYFGLSQNVSKVPKLPRGLDSSCGERMKEKGGGRGELVGRELGRSVYLRVGHVNVRAREPCLMGQSGAGWVEALAVLTPRLYTWRGTLDYRGTGKIKLSIFYSSRLVTYFPHSAVVSKVLIIIFI